MKKITSIFFLLLSTFILFAQAAKEGMQFHQGDWAAALEKAEKENKLVFLDAYTSWCGPCKKMSRDIFPKGEVGEYYNAHFVNVKMDMEKGEGLVLAKKHNVQVYPTLIFFSPDGRVVHRSAGYHTVEQFLELGAVANDPSKRLSSLSERYAQGDRDPGFLKKYAIAKFEVMDGSHGRIAEEYLATQSDWSTEENMDMIFNFVTGAESKLFDYLIAHKPAFYKRFGEKAVIQKVQAIIYNSIQDNADASALEQVDALYKKVYPEKADMLSAKFRMGFYRQAGDRENYAKAAVNYFKKFPSDDWDELNETAWTFYRVVEDKKLLKKAVKWAKKSIRLNCNYFNNDTLAALYFKLGKKGRAKKAAQKAIEIGREAGEDVSATQEMLTKILETTTKDTKGLPD
ncbi:MAG TPA: thioredoxin family protein [Phaeodactylibacter sp.]|nr:thioredoxin family protein [Phaeodactylibacter sp.]